MNTIYTHRTKLADIVAANSDMLSILQRLDISLGFGEATVAEICNRYNMSAELFLIICNIYSFNDYKPNINNLELKDLRQITHYLRASHKYYRENCFPNIHEKIHRLVKDLDNVSKHLIDKFYDDYDNELNRHFGYEENNVFPYIDALLTHKEASNSEFRISKFEKNHSNIDEKLNDLKNILIKYLPCEYSSPLRFEILKEIYAVESDICKHSLIENKLLIPLVEKIEYSNEQAREI